MGSPRKGLKVGKEASEFFYKARLWAEPTLTNLVLLVTSFSSVVQIALSVVLDVVFDRRVTATFS